MTTWKAITLTRGRKAERPRQTTARFSASRAIAGKLRNEQKAKACKRHLLLNPVTIMLPPKDFQLRKEHMDKDYDMPELR